MLQEVRFLVIDDQAAIRQIVTEILRAAGARWIDYATDGASGLEAVRDKKPDIVIADVQMQGMDGLDFVRLLRCAPDTPNPFLPVIMLTAHTDIGRVAMARDVGVTEFASKPISAANLLQRINAVILRPRPFIRSESYFGPCRRRRVDERLAQQKRRKTDQ